MNHVTNKTPKLNSAKPISNDINSPKIRYFSKNWKSESVIAILTMLLGAMLHFVYAWSGKSDGTAWVAAIDESVWEHLKLLTMACTVFTLFIIIYWGKQYLPGRLIGIVCANLFICIVFYTYTIGRTQPSMIEVDLVTFALAIILATLISNKIVTTSNKAIYICTILYIIMISIFIAFSYQKPSDGEPFISLEE